MAETPASDRPYRYIKRDMRRVEGWLNPLTATVVAYLGQRQTEQGVVGAVGEIGVHHGKFWLVLDHVATPAEARFAIDIFDRQDLNEDRSGSGDRAAFEANRAAFGADAGAPVVIASPSQDVRPEALREKVGPVRLFSIDGGHTPECTLNDLTLADAVLSEDGVVALDDVFNAHFPGVVAGLSAYLARNNSRLVPVAIPPGKLLLARPERADTWRAVIEDAFRDEVLSSNRFFGRDVPTLMRNIDIARRAKAVVGGTPIEPLARRAFGALFR